MSTDEPSAEIVITRVESAAGLCTREEAKGVLVTTKRPQLEQKDALKRRIEEAARFVDIDQLCLSPQCGFSSTVEGNRLSIDDELAKLRLVVETAAEVWGEA